jgi:DUF1009 family protein
MPTRKRTGPKLAASAKFIIGRDRFLKICAVEGIKPTAAMTKRAEKFQREGLSPAERRREIIKIYRKA